MKKITKAMELVATSRIAKAQARVAASLPYAQAITGVLTALASNASIDHPLLTPRPTVRRAGVLVITSDRGLAGGYSSNAIRTAESLIARLRADGKDTVLYVVGRKGTGYYRFRKRPIAASWTGFSEQPTFADAREVGQTVLEALNQDAKAASGDDEAARGIRVRARGRGVARRVAAEVRQHPYLRGVARVGGQRVGRAPAGHEER